MAQPINVLDLQVLGPLQLDELSFESIVDIMRKEGLPTQQWFPGDIHPDKIARSLKRLVNKGFANCYADSTVGASPIPPPPLPLLKNCWFGLTPAGADLFRHPGPWDYLFQKWTHLPTPGALDAAINDLRRHPENWFFMPTARQRAVAKGLAEFTNHLSTLRRLGGPTVIVHAFERDGRGPYELLQGHFRFLSDSPPKTLEVINLAMGDESLTNVDRMMLDVLQDDVECLETIVGLLNHENTPYRQWHFGQQFTKDEVRVALARLIEAGYVMVYQAAGDPVVLRPTSTLGPDGTGFWFGLTDEGRQIASKSLSWDAD